MLLTSREQREQEYRKRWASAKKLTLPSWWMSLEPRAGARFWTTVEAMRREAGIRRDDRGGIEYIVRSLSIRSFKMATQMDDILKALTSKSHGSLMAETAAAMRPAPSPSPTRRTAVEEPRTYCTGFTSNSTVYNPATPPRVFPSDRMGYVNSPSSRPWPKRAAFNMFAFSDDDLDMMLNTPVKRGWDFNTWLEVIGWPSDLHPKHDGASYNYAEKAFIRLKQAAHRG